MMVGQLQVKALRDTKGFSLVFTLLPSQKNMSHATIRRETDTGSNPDPSPQLEAKPRGAQPR